MFAVRKTQDTNARVYFIIAPSLGLCLIRTGFCGASKSYSLQVLREDCGTSISGIVPLSTDGRPREAHAANDMASSADNGWLR